jgi:UMF1 family MFS transporter
MNKTQRAWAFYDWSNSVYSLVISTAVFPLYFDWVAPEIIDIQWLFGRTYHYNSSALYSYVLAASFISVALLLPILSGMADRLHKKRLYMRRFLDLGAFSCMAMFFFTEENILLGLGLSYLASIGFWSSLVFYNAYLPVIAERGEQDALSARGFSLGYIGSSLLLLICLGLILSQPDDASKKMAFRISFVLVGLWWAGFARRTLKRLPPELPKLKESLMSGIHQGFQRLGTTYKALKEIPVSLPFLFSYFLMSTGVQTIILLASLYGSDELGLESAELIGTILVIQFVGILGAWGFSKLSSKWGNIQALMISVAIWVIICILAYLLQPSDPFVRMKFYGVAALVGLVMGGTQSLCRSTFSKLLPREEEEHSGFFSFMEVTEKLAIVLGTSLFGVVTQFSGGMRYGALSLALFFLLAFFLLNRLRGSYKTAINQG